MAEAASLDERVAEYIRALRTRFEAHLEQRFGANPSFDRVLESYLESFDDAADLDGRVSITASTGMPVECPPPEDIADRMKMSTLIYCTMAPNLKDR